MRRGQLTLLLLLGLVLLIIFGLIFILRSRLMNAKLGSEGTSAANPALVRRAIAERVQGCLATATQQALVLAGLQGGVIYEYLVPGTALAFSPSAVPYAEWFLPYGGHNVSYGIRASAVVLPPDYPLPGPLGSRPLQGYLGEETLRRLCDSEGENTWNLSGAQYTCISYDLAGSPHSVQEYLQAFILMHLPECVNFTEVAKGVTVSVGTPNVTVLFGDADVEVQLFYPVEVQGVAEQERFSYKSGVRFKKLYELAYRLAQEDTRDLTLDLSSQESVAGVRNCPTPDRANVNDVCLKPGMNVSIADAPCIMSGLCSVNAHADIVRITDAESLVEGTPFVLQFARENRAPALDYVDESEMSGAYRTYLQNVYGLREDQRNPYLKTARNPYPGLYHIALNTGDALQLIPYGLDPDEDNLTYGYSGWKTPGGIPGIMDPFYDTPVASGDAGGVDGINYWQDVSPLYRQSGKDSSYTTTREDVGFKMVRISIRDPAGLMDWQDIGIMVNDRPDFSMAVGGDCGSGYTLSLSCEDRFFADYRVEIFDSINVCLNQTVPSCTGSVRYGAPGAQCGDRVRRTLFVRVSDEFGASSQQVFTAC